LNLRAWGGDIVEKIWVRVFKVVLHPIGVKKGYGTRF